MSDWTPGPWRVWEKSATSVMGPHKLGGDRSVCSTGGYTTNTDNGEHIAENEANARLIAAAPEMAEWMRDFVDYWMGRTRADGDPCWEIDRIHQAERLLERIEGKSDA